MQFTGPGFALMMFAAALPAAATPPALAVTPAAAERFTILSVAGRHGQSARWTTPDGTRMGRESFNLRGQKFEFDSAAHLGADGMLDRLTIQGSTPNGDAGESLQIRDGRAAWTSPVDKGSKPYAARAEYTAFGGPIALTAELVEALLAVPNRRLPLLPAGSASAAPLATVSVGSGPARRTVTAYAVTGLATSPTPVWVDEENRFFAAVGGISWVREGYEADQPALAAAQAAALSARSRGVLAALLTTPTGPVAFTHVRAFVDGVRFLADQTVIVERGVITAVGPASRTRPPRGAQIIDGRGKTLTPGLWDAHQHVGGDAAGPLLLSLGITSVRDPGNVDALTIARATRRAAGDLLMPHVYASSMIDGRGPNTAQVANVATSEADAIELVRKAKAEGFVGIKFYGTFNPAWLPAAAAEAHRLGLHVHGHLPAGLRPSQAIEAGYDEFTHIYFVMMEAMPASVVEASNGFARFEGPGRFAKDVDLTAEPMRSLIATIARRHIAVDPTLVVAEQLLVPEPGELSAAYGPFVGVLPPAVVRGFREGGFAPPPGYSRADYRASFAKMSALVGALHKAGVRIVAGTDRPGYELVRELELYVAAGFTPAEALASATVETARLVGVEARTGTIAVGKAADLVLVQGDPSRDIGDLRRTRVVMMDGKLMDADALRAAGGFSGRPQIED